MFTTTLDYSFFLFYTRWKAVDRHMTNITWYGLKEEMTVPADIDIFTYRPALFLNVILGDTYLRNVDDNFHSLSGSIMALSCSRATRKIPFSM